MDLEWNVYRYDINDKMMKVFNVFNHYRFCTDVLDLLNDKALNLDDFKKKLRSSAMYYFFCKYEYEIVITTFPPCITKKEVDRIKSENNENNYHYVDLEISDKIDIYQQLDLNWNKFVDYLWDYKKGHIS